MCVKPVSCWYGDVLDAAEKLPQGHSYAVYLHPEDWAEMIEGYEFAPEPAMGSEPMIGGLEVRLNGYMLRGYALFERV